LFLIIYLKITNKTITELILDIREAFASPEEEIVY
jgi:hypothetical protein